MRLPRSRTQQKANTREADDQPGRPPYLWLWRRGVRYQGQWLRLFLLLFYGTVVGLEPALAGTALPIALLFDAFSGKSIVGYWSDNTRSPLGTTPSFHGYAAAIPVALCFPCCGSRPIGMTGRCFCISLY